MAYENPLLMKTFKAAEDMSSYQFHFVTQSDFETVKLMDNATDVPIGILQNTPSAAGQIAEVMILGISKCKANAAIAVATRIKPEFVSTSDCGKADAADTEADLVSGVVMFPSGAEDDLCSVLLAGVPSKLSFDVS